VQTIIVYSENKEEQASIAKELSTLESLKIETIENGKDVTSAITNETVRCLVYGVAHFKQDELKNVGRFRTSNPTLGILVVSSKSDPSCILAIKEMKRVVAIEKPLKNDELTKLCLKLAKGEVLYQRDMRFPTQQLAKTENVENNETAECIIYNMSKSGAFVEVLSGTVKTGDLLKISIQLKDIDKERLVHGQVVWTVPKSMVSGKPGAGLKFMSADDFYGSLLERV